MTAEHRQTLQPIDRKPQKLERCRVRPMHVFPHREHRLACCQSRDLIDQRAERAFALLLPVHLMRGIPPAGRDRQQRREQRHRTRDILTACAQHRLELRELLRRVVATRKIRRALDMRDHRLQRAVQPMRRA